MKKEIVAISWNDVLEFESENLNEENFTLAPTLQLGILFDEDDQKIRLVHSFSLEDEEHDFIVIPKSLIIDRKVLGLFDLRDKKILINNQIRN